LLADNASEEAENNDDEELAEEENLIFTDEDWSW